MTNRIEFLNNAHYSHEHTTEEKKSELVCIYLYALIYLHSFHFVSLDVDIYCEYEHVIYFMNTEQGK